MSFTSCVLTHSFLNPDGTPASGTVEATLTKRMSNGTQSIMPGSVTSTLSGEGGLSQALASNADTGTTPTDAQWRLDVRIAGAEPESYFVTVPAADAVDLGLLLAGIEG